MANQLKYNITKASRLRFLGLLQTTIIRKPTADKASEITENQEKHKSGGLPEIDPMTDRSQGINKLKPVFDKTEEDGSEKVLKKDESKPLTKRYVKSNRRKRRQRSNRRSRRKSNRKSNESSKKMKDGKSNESSDEKNDGSSDGQSEGRSDGESDGGSNEKKLLKGKPYMSRMATGQWSIEAHRKKYRSV